MAIRFELETDIDADPERVFDLSRDLDLHRRSMRTSGETIVGGRTSGLIGPGEEVTFEGRHFGFRHRHTSRITAFDRPRYFRDEMIRGRFERFRHDHRFEPAGTGTRMTDVVEFQSPFGLLGTVVDRVLLKSYLKRLIEVRNSVIKTEAESRDGADFSRS